MSTGRQQGQAGGDVALTDPASTADREDTIHERSLCPPTIRCVHSQIFPVSNWSASVHLTLFQYMNQIGNCLTDPPG